MASNPKGEDKKESERTVKPGLHHIIPSPKPSANPSDKK